MIEPLILLTRSFHPCYTILLSFSSTYLYAEELHQGQWHKATPIGLAVEIAGWVATITRLGSPAGRIPWISPWKLATTHQGFTRGRI